jgi:hypothetical protein
MTSLNATGDASLRHPVTIPGATTRRPLDLAAMIRPAVDAMTRPTTTVGVVLLRLDGVMMPLFDDAPPRLLPGDGLRLPIDVRRHHDTTTISPTGDGTLTRTAVAGQMGHRLTQLPV